MDKEYYQTRLSRLPQFLSNGDVDGFLIEDPLDLYYLTGMELSRGTLMVSALGASLFVDSRYFEACQEASLLEVYHEQTLDEWLEKHVAMHAIGFDASELTYQRYLDWQNRLSKLGREDLSLAAYPSPLKQMRQIKDHHEIELLRQAASLGSLGYDFTLSLLKEGISESYVAMQLEMFWKLRAARGLAFDPIIAFGANTSKPHHRAGDALLKPGDAVLIDIGVNWQHYHSDMTRTVYFQKPQPKIKEIHAIVLEAQLAALALCRPGCLMVDLDKAARQVIEAYGYGSHFTHSLGHGIGLEVHEGPSIRQTNHSACLEEGMVITIEPGIYLPQMGGVRIEDSVLITSDGHENLTKRSKDFLAIY